MFITWLSPQGRRQIRLRRVLRRLSSDQLTWLKKNNNKGVRAMSRAKYCIEQASRCRELAQQMSSQLDAKRLREMAEGYEADARSLEGEPVQQHAQQQQQPQSREEPPEK
jgi:hypothetical protein